MKPPLTRREFLKTAAFVPLLLAEWPQYLQKASNLLNDQNLPNILILVFDALSAKHMSLYGYKRETTPNLGRFAQRAIVYHSHYAAGNFTTPGTASILTGNYPWSHRAFHLFGTVAENFKRKNIFNLVGTDPYHSLAYTHNDLANLLLFQFHQYINELKPTKELCLFHESFLADRAFINDYNLAFSTENEIFQGLLNDHLPNSIFLSMVHQLWRVANKRKLQNQYRSLFPRGVPSLNGSLSFFILENAIDWIISRLKNVSQPFLAYFHLLPPHAPYATRSEFMNLFEDGWNAPGKEPHFFSEGYSDSFLSKKRREYDEYIAYADAEFGRLFDYMELNGLLDDTYVIFTSDHGEMFERGILAHETPTLFEPIIRVPLILSGPGQRERMDVQHPTTCIDLVPTLLKITGRSIPDWCEGEVLPPFEKQDERRNIFCIEAKSSPKQAPLKKATIALIKGDYKLIHYAGYGNDVPEYELFDIANDPEEQADLSSSRRAISSELKDILQGNLQQANEPYS